MISAVILTHNDETSIEKTLGSLSWCDEIVVIDDDSTDKTSAIAKKMGANIFVHSLHDNFAQQRNFGLSKAKGEWVLFVDSDEIVSDELAKEIQHSVGKGAAGYYLRRRDVMWGRELTHGETANVRLLRFAKKDAGKWERPVHEVWNVQGETKTLTYPLMHYPHPDVAQFIEEINRYSNLNAKHFYEKGVRTNMGQIILYPLGKFFINYVWHFGFLDGMAGALVAAMMSFHSFLTRAKLYQLQKSI